MSPMQHTANVESSLRAGSGIRQDELAGIVEQFGSLDARLRSFPAGSVDLELSVKERDTASQRTVLEAEIAGRNRLVATSTHTTMAQALAEVRDDLIRQITDSKTRTEPRNSRQHRDTAP